MDNGDKLFMMIIALYAVWQLCRVARAVESISTQLLSQPAPPRIQRQWRLSQLIEARARRGADDPAVERCRPEEAAEIVAALGGRFAAAADPSRPKPQGGNPDRGARMPSREDYVRMFGVDPGDAIAPATRSAAPISPACLARDRKPRTCSTLGAGWRGAIGARWAPR